MLYEQSYVKTKLRNLLLKAFYRIENNNYCDFEKNGEQRFINDLFKLLSTRGGGKKLEIFDIGANIGEYTKMLLDKCDTQENRDVLIHVFEPTKACSEELERRFGDNPRVLINKKAVSNDNGKAEIFFDREKSELASLCKRDISSCMVNLDKSEEIDTIRLEQYIESNNIQHIFFLKIDIEGYEMEAFKGLGKYLSGEFIDFIQFEYGGTNLDSHLSLLEIYNILCRSGFKIAKVMPKGLHIRGYQPWMDNFQYANYVAISEKIISELK
ncbi:MAG: FkbM family methyltransferase [Clostridia bacterium]|nr:FkbM family methyltransferase [Clostridia bacterium]